MSVLFACGCGGILELFAVMGVSATLGVSLVWHRLLAWWGKRFHVARKKTT